MKKIKLLACVCVAVMLAGCGGNEEPAETTSDTSGDTQTSVITNIGMEVDEIETGTRPLEEGDDWAINKINNRSPKDELPGGYVLTSYTEEQQGKLFANGSSKIIIRAYNYKDDLQDLATWADQACAIIKISNITSACDTNYAEPENITLFGFDAIKYDYEVIQYEFIEDSSGESVKSPIGTYKGIAYYFYTDQDAYAIMFDSAEADFEEQSANFQAFMDDLEITRTEY